MDGTNEKELWPEKAKEIYFSFVPKKQTWSQSQWWLLYHMLALAHSVLFAWVCEIVNLLVK